MVKPNIRHGATRDLYRPASKADFAVVPDGDTQMKQTWKVFAGYTLPGVSPFNINSTMPIAPYEQGGKRCSGRGDGAKYRRPLWRHRKQRLYRLKEFTELSGEHGQQLLLGNT